APLWARAATVLAGPAFNMIFSVLLLTGLYLAAGVATNPPTVGRLDPLPPAQTGTLKAGDVILALNGMPTPDTVTLAGLAAKLDPAPTVRYSIRRDGTEMTVDGPYPMPPRADGVAPDSAAGAAGLKFGDVIEAVNGTPVYAFDQLRQAVTASQGKPLALTVWHDGAVRQVTLTPRRSDVPTASGGFETRWLIGITGGLAFTPNTRMPGVLEALGRAFDTTRYTVVTSLSGLYHMITGAISSCNLHGPIGIAETSGMAASQGTMSFLNFIAMLSTAVGLLNLFPVPVLDGGHLVFHAWEAVTGRPPSDFALRVLMGGGLVLILSLMLFALSNDLLCP
ncbi:MAG: RIP metalloprotease RseP, partial [Paracoccaceae bacterium]|nr:RIP metalloprotease RseP [Paracoccaceae bacterium]